MSGLTRLARGLLLTQLRKIRYGRLRLVDVGRDETFGGVTDAVPLDVTIRVRSPRFYSDAVFGGTTGAGEAYMNGYWDCDNLTGLVRLMVINRDLMNDVDSGWSRLSAPLLKLAHWLNRNDKSGSRRNISAHYDLGNEFFELFLDETMAYSCAFFPHGADLLEASIAKFDAACSKLELKAGPASARDRHRLGRPRDPRRPALWLPRHHDHHLARAIRARAGTRRARGPRGPDHPAARGLPRPHGANTTRWCRSKWSRRSGTSTSTPIFAAAAVCSRPPVRCCCRPSPSAISSTIKRKRSVDFIKRFIFPGSFIPSVKALADSVERATDLKIFHMEDIGPHYARTLKIWRERFLARQSEVRALGYPEAFVRMWEYYLCYCEGGFEERQLGNVQMLLTKPLSRRAPIATVHAAPP